jgi:hypothetical protein
MNAYRPSGNTTCEVWHWDDNDLECQRTQLHAAEQVPALPLAVYTFQEHHDPILSRG